MTAIEKVTELKNQERAKTQTTTEDFAQLMGEDNWMLQFPSKVTSNYWGWVIEFSVPEHRRLYCILFKCGSKHWEYDRCDADVRLSRTASLAAALLGAEQNFGKQLGLN